MAPQDSPAPGPLIGIVGPCGSGKSTLAARLVERGLSARAIAQEHSYVPAMWQRIANPGLLVFLQASYPACTRRRQLVWTEREYEEQLRRLAHAYAHADLRIDTDSLNPDEVQAAVMGRLGLEPLSPQGV
jgi:deoxyadenosine/deoxycytidine kinase